MERSVLDLSTEELLQMKESGVFPVGVSLAGIEERKDFDSLYRHRNNPSLIAEILLKNTRKTAKDGLSPEQAKEKAALGQKRAALKEKELEIRKERTIAQTYILKDLKTHITRLETKLDLLIEETFKNRQTS